MSVQVTDFPQKANTSEPFTLKGTATDVDDGDELLILVDGKFDVARPRVQGGKWEVTLIFNQAGDRKIEVIASDQDRTEIKLPLESGDVSVISRRTWGARNSRNSLANLPNPKRITIHHTVFPTLSAMASQGEEEGRMKAIQTSHMDGPQGFSDIGYHFVIMPSGRIYEGRPNGKKGAHDIINDGFGIAMEGSFQLSDSKITDQQFNSAVALCVQLCKRMGIADPTTLVSTPIKKAGKDVMNLPRIIGHRDRFNTECPGVDKGTTVRLEEIRQAVKKALL